MKGRTVSMEIKKELRDTVVLPALTYASETFVLNEVQKSTIQAAEMSYLSGACGVTRLDGESNESVYNRFGMSYLGRGKECGVVRKSSVAH